MRIYFYCKTKDSGILTYNANHFCWRDSFLTTFDNRFEESLRLYYVDLVLLCLHQRSGSSVCTISFCISSQCQSLGLFFQVLMYSLCAVPVRFLILIIFGTTSRSLSFSGIVRGSAIVDTSAPMPNPLAPTVFCDYSLVLNELFASLSLAPAIITNN